MVEDLLEWRCSLLEMGKCGFYGRQYLNDSYNFIFQPFHVKPSLSISLQLKNHTLTLRKQQLILLLTSS
jgi:hypothetical protein